ncbi:LysM domain-containing protein [Streptomyces sp. NPDC050439]|uniref:LysM peptidoglycan-binding domain-containing protein n=1 Tax=unclassified Streptomyces TaxID=2593676 RepID=UPI003444A7A8
MTTRLKSKPGSGSTSYTVREHDTLSKIAKTRLGSAARWGEIAKLNGIKDPYVIHAGQKLKLPKK